jgi:hypothetical protein
MGGDGTLVDSEFIPNPRLRLFNRFLPTIEGHPPTVANLDWISLFRQNGIVVVKQNVANGPKRIVAGAQTELPAVLGEELFHVRKGV